MIGVTLNDFFDVKADMSLLIHLYDNYITASLMDVTYRSHNDPEVRQIANEGYGIARMQFDVSAVTR